MNEQRNAKYFIDEAFKIAREAPEVGQSELAIWGGTFAEDKLNDFLEAWRHQLHEKLLWRMYEYASRFEVLRVSATDPALPTSNFDFERARFFGADGDLELRRDGSNFHWHFIGVANGGWPSLSPDFNAQNFWAEQTGGLAVVFREIKQRYFQWRKSDERVTPDWFAKTNLPHEGVYLNQLHYLLNGRVAFVRYTGFNPNEVHHG